MKIAIVIGATGLVGSNLTKKLLGDERYSQVKIFVRKSSGIDNPKLKEFVVEFDELEKWKEQIRGNELFSAMGTTLKKAGDKNAQYKIDFTYQYNFAKTAAENSVEKYLLVSSVGANPKSRNFYLRMKGELDEKIAELPFKQTFIFRPSILAGERNERRIGEEIGTTVIKFFTKFVRPLKKYRPMEGSKVAEAMIKAANQITHSNISIYELDQIFEV